MAPVEAEAMTGERPTGEVPANQVAAVVVTYHPEPSCADLVTALSAQCQWVVVVDNGSSPGELQPLREACARTGAHLAEMGDNLGIAAAQNHGIVRARELGARWVLLSDHDSVPSPGMVDQLLAAFRADQRDDPGGSSRRVAAAGPLVGEDRQGRDQLVYVARRWGPRRATPGELEEPYLTVAFLIASGCLVSVEALDHVGLMREDLFIDHVDLEWGLRARRAGYRLVVATGTPMTHRLGDEVVRLPGRRQPVHVHAPVRSYYLVRNTLILLRSGLLPVAWRVGYTVWLAKYTAFNAVLADRRRQRVSALAHGLVDGLRGRGGARPS
ncbi:glycosyltransferase family 2 protein [Actinomyces wuliandei]|uniref:glycosyltransferase family 2 protein n=1 Tax=Actinomyces wuliandei TaxID=2057743 RepID=UPI001FA959DF|nr:glycosyltransferase family 2 protein [Actinomyces wuliandei]